jgi:hypothetical protein
VSQRYYISRFDGGTYQIVDSIENREFCVCSNFDDFSDAEERARMIVKVLNDAEEELHKAQS